MKKIKKILLTAVAMTMLASTAASAMTLEEAAKQNWATVEVSTGVTYQDQFINSLKEMGVPEERANEVAAVVTKLPGLTEQQMDAALVQVDKALKIVDGDFSKEAMTAIKNDPVKTGQLMNVATNLGNALGVFIAPDVNNLNVKVYTDDSCENLLLDWDKAKLATFKANQETLVASVQDSNKVKTVSSQAVELSNNDAGKEITKEVSVWDTFTDAEKQGYVDAMTKAEELDDILKKAEANNGGALASKMDELKKIVADMPDGELKTQLQAAIDEYEKKYGKFEEGKSYKLEEGSSIEDVINGGANNAAQNGSASKGNAFQATNGTLKKTATNNGNMAVAGLAMIAVAGTVFVVSKKKIAE